MRVLLTTRAAWYALTVGGVLVLALIGTSAAWRARTGTEESVAVGTEALRSPAVDLSASEEISKELPVGRAQTLSPSVPVQTLTAAVPTELNDDLRDPFTGTSIGDERAQRAHVQSLRTTQYQLEMAQTEVKIAEQRKELARLWRETRAITHPPRAGKPAAPTPIPHVTVLSVSSTAALVQGGRWRQVVRLGSRLNGWTVTRLAPTGITLRREQRRAVLPLSFAARPVVAR